MAIAYPPKFEKDLLYPREYNLENLPMPSSLEGIVDNWSNISLGQYFNIYFPPNSPNSGVPLLSFGKHYFILTYNPSPIGFPQLKNNSKILFEFKDSLDNQNNRRVIFSDITPYKGISNYFVGYVWLKEDPLRTYDSLVGGQGTLNIVGQVQTTDSNWKNKFNVRTQIPIDIDLSGTNPNLGTSPILFQTNSGSLANSFVISESRGTNNNVPEQSYVHISASNLQTYGGEVKDISVEYLLSSSLVADLDNEYKPLQIHRLGNGQKTLYEQGVSIDFSDGVNPISEEWKVYVPPTTINRGPDKDGNYEKVKFKLTFANSANSTAQNLFASESKNFEVFYPSGSNQWLEFTGSSFVQTGEDNLVLGQVFINDVTKGGIEIAGGSALIKSVGYKGFTSASAGSGSGFLIYSASVMSDITDDYSTGGVGLELVRDSSSYFRFRTTGSGFPKGELDIRTDSFFLGSNSQFVSGSDGNIEISSSGFHLKPTGDVVISGSIEASTGKIGGFSINGNDLTGSNASIVTSDPASAGQKVIIDGKNSNIEFHQNAKGGSIPTAKIGHILTITDGDGDSIKYYGLSVSHSSGKIKLTSDADATDLTFGTGFYEDQVPLLSKLNQKTPTVGVGSRLNGAIVGIGNSVNTTANTNGILAGTVGLSTGSIWKRRAGLFGVSAGQYKRMDVAADTLPVGDFGLGVFGDTYIAGKTELSGSLNVTGSVNLSGSNTFNDLQVSMSKVTIDAKNGGIFTSGTVIMSDVIGGGSNIFSVDAGEGLFTGNLQAQNFITPANGFVKVRGSGSIGTNILSKGAALVVKGNISGSGEIYGKQTHFMHHAYIEDQDDGENFIPMGGTLIEVGNTQFYNKMIAPYDGEIKKVWLNAENDPGTTSVKFFKNGSAVAKQNISDASITSASIAFDNINTSISLGGAAADRTFSAGDLLQISITPANAIGEVQVTSVWLYTIVP